MAEEAEEEEKKEEEEDALSPEMYKEMQEYQRFLNTKI